MFLVTKSIHSLFSGSTNCLITTSCPFKSEALCIKATVMLPWASLLNSRSGGPSCDSSITLLTKSSLSLPRGGEKVLGFYNEQLISKGFVMAPKRNVTNAATSWSFQVSPSTGTLSLKNHNVIKCLSTMFEVYLQLFFTSPLLCLVC